MSIIGAERQIDREKKREEYGRERLTFGVSIIGAERQIDRQIKREEYGCERLTFWCEYTWCGEADRQTDKDIRIWT